MATTTLTVAIATFVTCQWNYLVAIVDKYNCKLHWLFVSETRKNWSQNYSVGVTRAAPSNSELIEYSVE